MAYLALYRRYRPSGFEGLIGQDHIVRTLKNQIATDRIGHAYLFCGARGTGKTSLAKIFAKAINCLSPLDGSPCGKCEVCKSLQDGGNLDILELDAASNNGVEDIREIREKVQYAPVVGKYKVYIIDEVHMLSSGAFNALLKTLEEPPKHAVFILATTEVHKLPATILSRCMRFDFRLIPTSQIADLIGKIYKDIGKEYEDEAVLKIASAGAGSIRDALSIADICVSYRQGKLTYNDVLEVLGATDNEKITRLIKNIFDGNTGLMLEDVESLSESGKSVGVLCKDIISKIREIIVCKTCLGGRKILELPEDVYNETVKTFESVDESRLLRALEIFSEADGSMRFSTNQRIILETACIKASQLTADLSIEALTARVKQLEDKLASGDFFVKEPKLMAEPKKVEADGVILNKVERVESVRAEETESEQAYFENEYIPPEEEPEIPFEVESKPILNVEQKPKADGVSQPMSAGKLWGNVIRKLRADKNIFLWVACQDMTAKMYGNTLKVVAVDKTGYQAVTKEDNLKTLTATVKSFGDYEVEIVMEVEDKVDEFDKDVENVKNTFGENIVKIKD